MALSSVFLDTGHLIGLFHEDDAWHDAAKIAKAKLSPDCELLTTNLVLTEFSNFFAKEELGVRDKVATWISETLEGDGVCGASSRRTRSLSSRRPSE